MANGGTAEINSKLVQSPWMMWPVMNVPALVADAVSTDPITSNTAYNTNIRRCG